MSSLKTAAVKAIPKQKANIENDVEKHEARHLLGSHIIIIIIFYHVSNRNEAQTNYFCLNGRTDTAS